MKKLLLTLLLLSTPAIASSDLTGYWELQSESCTSYPMPSYLSPAFKVMSRNYTTYNTPWYIDGGETGLSNTLVENDITKRVFICYSPVGTLPGSDCDVNCNAQLSDGNTVLRGSCGSCGEFEYLKIN